MMRKLVFENPSRIISNALLMGIIAFNAYPAFANNSPQENLRVSQASSIKNSVFRRLQGIWKLTMKNPENRDVFLVFTSNDEFYTYVPGENPQDSTVKGKYKINFNSQPMHLDLIPNDKEKEQLKTIIQFTKEGKLVMADSFPGKTRPQDFSSRTYTFSKISASTKFSDDLLDNFHAADLTNPVVKRLQGTWSFTNPKRPEEKNSLVFTPSGKLFLKNNGRWYRTRYKINSEAKPMHLDIRLMGTNSTVKTIFEFTSDGKLRIEMDKSAPGSPRPSTYPDDSPLLEKISDSTKEPDIIKSSSTPGKK